MGIKMISKEKREGKTVLTVEHSFLFWKTVRVFEQQQPSTLLTRWLELPKRKLVKPVVILQLDAWNNL